MKVYIVGYYSNFYDSPDEILCVYRNKEAAIKKVSELAHEASEINYTLNYTDTEESQKILNKYTNKYHIDPNEVVFYYKESELY